MGQKSNQTPVTRRDAALPWRLLVTARIRRGSFNKH
jgi:hypothetical protein